MLTGNDAGPLRCEISRSFILDLIQWITYGSKAAEVKINLFRTWVLKLSARLSSQYLTFERNASTIFQKLRTDAPEIEQRTTI